MDRRMEKRRREVAEGHARSGLSKVAVFLLLALVAGLAVWLFRSPLLSVHQIEVAGATPQLAEEVTALAGIEMGEPMVTVRPKEVEAAVAINPWVATVEVSLRWPQTITIEVTPRLPVAWAPADGTWALMGVDAVVLETAGAAGNTMPVLQIDESSTLVRDGGLAFLAVLGPLQFPGAVLTQQGEELWANVSGYTVRLGRPIDMEAKATALLALLGKGIAPGSTINLLAPTRPAVIVANAQPQVEP